MAGKRPGTRKRQVTPAGRVAWVILIAVVLIGAGLWVRGALAGPGATYKATVTGKAVINPATLSVSLRITNTGKASGAPSCTVHASDPSGSYSGVNQGSLATLAPGATVNTAMPVTVTSQGAQYVTQVSVSCS